MSYFDEDNGTAPEAPATPDATPEMPATDTPDAPAAETPAA